jgi:hypothetical protein
MFRSAENHNLTKRSRGYSGGMGMKKSKTFHDLAGMAEVETSKIELPRFGSLSFDMLSPRSVRHSLENEPPLAKLATLCISSSPKKRSLSSDFSVGNVDNRHSSERTISAASEEEEDGAIWFLNTPSPPKGKFNP